MTSIPSVSRWNRTPTSDRIRETGLDRLFEGVDAVPTDASLREADRDMRVLDRQGVELEAADWRLAAEVKADGSISLADAYAVALAHERNATLIAGADDDFERLPIEVDLHRFRDTVCDIFCAVNHTIQPVYRGFTLLTGCVWTSIPKPSR